MGISVSILLIAVGAILTWGVTADAEGLGFAGAIIVDRAFDATAAAAVVRSVLESLEQKAA